MENAKAYWLAEADSYIAECRTSGTSPRASEFARRMRRTPVQAVREFHASVGSTLKDHLAARRLDRAKELLLSTRRTTGQIARDSGYGTARSFYRAFRRAVGCTPTEYRERNVTGTS